MAIGYTYRGHVDGAVGSSSATSGPIPCAAGDALVVCVSADSQYQNSACTVTLSTGWGFPVRVDNTNVATDTDDGCYAGIFVAVPVPSDGAPTITATITGGTADKRRPSFDIWTVTGQHAATPVISTFGMDGYGDPINIWCNTENSAGNTVAIMTGCDGFKKGTPWFSGDYITDPVRHMYDQPATPGQRGISGFSAVCSWPFEGDHVYNYSLDPPGIALYAFAVVEFKPAPVPPSCDAGPPRSVERTKVLTITPTDADNGSTISSRQWKIQAGPAGAGSTIGSAKTLTWQPSTAGAYTLRYSVTNAIGTSTDDVVVTVTALRPAVDAGPDVAVPLAPFTRTATETAGDNAITSRKWTITDGPSGVGSTVGATATLSWTPPTLGRWTFAYTATSSAGTSTPDTFELTVGVSGVPIHLRRTPPVRFAVAIAFGGNLADPDGSEWVFTEVTTDVRVESGVHVRHGRADEASAAQPSQATFTLDNRSGRYSLGGRSPYWPNVRQGTPVQISADLGSGFKTIFTGYADGFTPQWSTRPLRAQGVTGDATVTVSASGSLRRLAQGRPPVISPLRRGLTGTAGVVAYWPCEDEETALRLASAFSGHPAMDYSGRLHGGSNPGLPAAQPRLAQDDGFWCSRPLPLVSDSEWYGVVPDYGSTDIIQLRCLISIPSAGSNDSAVILGMITDGDPGFWELRYKAGGLINVRAWRNFASLVVDSPSIALVPAPVSGMVGLDGRRGQLGLTLTRSGGTVTWVADFIEQGATVGYVYSGTVSGAAVGRALRVQTATDGGHFDVGLGHIVVRKDLRDAAAHVAQLNAWRGDQVGARLKRLADENGLWFTMIDGANQGVAVSDVMGPQPVGTVLELYRDCEVTDQGILWDGVGPGLSYTTKRYRESRAAALVLDATAGEVGVPFVPTHDDAYRVNRAAVTRRKGSSAVYADDTGPLGGDVVGRYDNSLTVGVRDDGALVQWAGWMVGQGTVEGYRYPRLALNLTARPGLLDEWLAIVPGDRVDVANLDEVTGAAPGELISLAVEGYEQTITPHTWDVVMNTSPYRRWAVAQVCAEAGDAQEFGARVDSDYSYITALTPAGQTTLTINVDIGPLWTTRADDYPMLLDVGAIAVRATGCTAAGVGGDPFRQTFTIDPMPVTRPGGVTVRVWQAPVYGL